MSNEPRSRDRVTASFSVIAPDPLADSYATDPRVEVNERKSFYTVTPDGQESLYVAHTDIFGWTLCQGPNLDFVQLPDGGVTNAHFAIGIPTAGEVIRAILGDPR